ncbi:phage major capsid protein [Thauera sinica]|uniref:Bacteriophage Mu GpT domain-containing protein n=1 Tax=Thauera sinica TaxID=2665146 RepID=A0ABW1ARL5_9RHOO|nr:hypothetical protein [Thauera sp. K11]ATE60162.1 hypothetical protein CCZ27_09565 [Thauera sp. K11]
MTIPAAGVVGARLIEAAATEVRAVIELVRQAVGNSLGRDWVSVEAMYPDRIVIPENGRLYAYPYTLTDDNQVQLGTRSEVTLAHNPVRFAEANGAFLEAVEGGRWLIRVIRAGLSGNANYYPDTVLRESAPLFEGARVFVKSDAEHLKGGGKDVRNLIGGLSNARFAEGAAVDAGEILADLTLIEPEGDVAVKLREAHARSLSGLFGFSVDVTGTARTELREGRKVRMAKSIRVVNSVDLIVEPGAGGELIRFLEAAPTNEEQDAMLRERLLRLLEAKAPKAYAKINPETITDEELEVVFAEALGAGAPDPARPPAADLALTEVRLVEARIVARDLVAAAKLPQPAKSRLLTRFAEAREVFGRADVEREIEAERAYLAQFTESGKPVINFEDAPRVEDRSVKIGEMLDDFFSGKNGQHSFRECYYEITGDRRVSGALQDCDESRMRESLGVRFAESLTSASFTSVLGNSITRRMLAEYSAQTDLQTWRKIATSVPVNDFRTNERTRFGGYGNLPAVNEAGGYNALSSPTDEKATYAVTKRGGTEDVTLEMIRNDDVGAIRRIPVKLALAAARTLYEFVFDFIRVNPVIYDTVALFHATHANLGASALDATTFAAARLAMVKQAEAGSSKRLGIGPRYILLPVDLQEAAYNLFVRNQNLDKTFTQTVNPEPIVVSYWVDANDWSLVADPNQIPTIEVGFLDGREEPEIFVQDIPNVGSLFSNDKVTYKIRHIYSGAVMDYRGLYKAVVA